MTTAERLRQSVEQAHARWGAASEDSAAARPDSGGWSAKQVLGHLIDSASNNHGRFVRAQLVEHLEFEGYEQDGWVERQGYQETEWAELLQLWRSYNLHLARVIENVPPDEAQRLRRRHVLDKIAWRSVPASEPTTLAYFMDDYVGHLEHHLAQIDALLAVPRV